MPPVLERGTARIIYGPLRAVVEVAKESRVEFVPAYSHRPVVAFVAPPVVGSPEVPSTSVPEATPTPVLVVAPSPKPISDAAIFSAVDPLDVKVADIDRTYAALLRSFSGTLALTKLDGFVGPSSPRSTTTASALLAVPSVVTPPLVLPVKVTAPPELISTNFETVPVKVTVPLRFGVAAGTCAFAATATTLVMRAAFTAVLIVFNMVCS